MRHYVWIIVSICLLCIYSLEAKENKNMSSDDITVVIETTQGIMKLKLMPSIAPKACENFIGLINKKYYDGIQFHRIIKGFMIQTGDPTATGSGGESIWGDDFEDEFQPDTQFTKPGLLAMANRGPNTNGSQFFITTEATPWLNNRHTIFGEVIEGIDVLEKLEAVETDPRDRPIQEQKMLKVYVQKEQVSA